MTIRYVIGVQWKNGADPQKIRDAQKAWAESWAKHEIDVFDTVTGRPIGAGLLTWMMGPDLRINTSFDNRTNPNWHWAAMGEFEDTDNFKAFVADKNRLEVEARYVVPHIGLRKRIAFDARGMFRSPGVFDNR
jgi:hypothetical protein